MWANQLQIQGDQFGIFYTKFAEFGNFGNRFFLFKRFDLFAQIWDFLVLVEPFGIKLKKKKCFLVFLDFWPKIWLFSVTFF